jgi:hypothetical protein
MDGVLASMDEKQREAQPSGKKPPKAVRAPAVSPELRELIHMLEAIEAEAPARAKPRTDR